MTNTTMKLLAGQLLAGGLLVASGCFSERVSGPDGGSGTPCDGTTTACVIQVSDNTFTPATQRVVVGSTVRWVNQGPSPHTSTSTGGVWNSGNLNDGQSYERVFDAAGSFGYECIYHPGMTGTVVVE